MAGDGSDPAAERRRIAQLADARVGGEKHVLDEVVDVAAGHAAEQDRVNHPDVVGIKPGERVLIAGGHGPNGRAKALPARRRRDIQHGEDAVELEHMLHSSPSDRQTDRANDMLTAPTTFPPLTPSYTFSQYVAMQYIRSRMLDRELKKGSAELLILSLVEDQPRHGYDLSKLIEARSGGVLKFRVASLYPLLYRLEKRGWIQGRWIERAGQRRRRYYRLTPSGANVLASQRSTWREFVEAINRIAGVEHG